METLKTIRKKSNNLKKIIILEHDQTGTDVDLAPIIYASYAVSALRLSIQYSE